MVESFCCAETFGWVELEEAPQEINRCGITIRREKKVSVRFWKTDLEEKPLESIVVMTGVGTSGSSSPQSQA